jgi:hypothetical protein
MSTKFQLQMDNVFNFLKSLKLYKGDEKDFENDFTLDC